MGQEGFFDFFILTAQLAQQLRWLHGAAMQGLFM